MLHTHCFLPWLLLLTRPICTHAWSRPMWYQVGLDLQPWGCQPRSLEGCESSLGCPGYWTGLGTNRIYPVAGVTVTTTMMLMLSRALMQRRRSQASKSEVSRAPSPLPPTSVPTHVSCRPPHPSLPPQGPYVCPQPTVPGHFLWVVPYRILPLATFRAGGYLSRLPPVISLALTQPAWAPRPHEATSGCSLILHHPKPPLPSTPPSLPCVLTPASWSCPQHPQLASHPCTTWKRQRPISDRALLLGVLHMLDALLLHIECYLQRLATQQRSQIKGTPAQTG